MKALIAEDDAVSRRIFEDMLGGWGYDVVATPDGIRAWEVLRSREAPPLAILDWMMPGMDGVEVCRKVRESPKLIPTYIILLTARDRKEDIVAGLEAGANDYISKPFDTEELRVRIQVGKRMIELQSELAARIEEIEEAMAHIKTLQGILPICSYCKKIRNDQNYWQKLESYLYTHTDVQFSHGICPDCYEKYIAPQIKEKTNTKTPVKAE